MAGETNNQPATASAPAVDQTRPQESQNDQNNRSQLNDSQSSSNDATNNSNATRNNNDDSDKCNRCDRAIRKFEDSIKCSSSEQYCDRVFHRRCVLPYSANDDLADDRWKCEHCYIVRPVENITYRTERVVSPRHHDDSYEYRLRDGRSHLCKNSNCPQIRAYSTKVKSSSDYVIDSSHTKSHMYIAPTVESRREYVTSRPVDVVEEKVVVTDLDTSRYYRYAPKVETEYVVREEVPATYKTYSYVEPQVDFVPAHVERVEITEIAQGIDERIRYREPVVEKVVELRSRPEPVVEKVIEVKRQEPVVEVRRPEPVVEKVVEVKRQEPVVEVRRPEPVVEVRRPEPVVEVRRPEPVVEVKRPEPVVEKVVEVRRQEPVIEFRRPEVYTYAVVDDTHVIEDSHEYFYYATDEDKQVVVEKQQNQDCQHQCRFHQPLSYRSPKVTHKSTVSYDIPLTVSVPTTSTKKITTKQIQVNSTVSESDLLKMRQMERQLNEQASKLRQQEDRIGELQVYLRRLESPEPPKVMLSRVLPLTSTIATSTDTSICEPKQELIDEDEVPPSPPPPPRPPTTSRVLSTPSPPPRPIFIEPIIRRVSTPVSPSPSPSPRSVFTGSVVQPILKRVPTPVTLPPSPPPVHSFADSIVQSILSRASPTPPPTPPPPARVSFTESVLQPILRHASPVPVTPPPSPPLSVVSNSITAAVSNITPTPQSTTTTPMTTFSNESHLTFNIVDILTRARDESVREGNDWRTSLIDEVARIATKYPPSSSSSSSSANPIVTATTTALTSTLITTPLTTLTAIHGDEDEDDDDDASQRTLTEKDKTQLEFELELERQQKKVKQQQDELNEKLKSKLDLDADGAADGDVTNKHTSQHHHRYDDDVFQSHEVLVDDEEEVDDDDDTMRTAAEKKASALSLIVDGIKDGKRFIEDKSKSTIVSLTKPAPKLEVPNIKVQPPQVPRLNVDLQNGYDSLTSKKGNLTRSEINLRFDDSVTLGDGKNTISSRISDKYFTDSIRTGSLERSSSALATVYDGNRGKDGIYEYVRPISASAIPKASYKGYLERIRFDKILFITEKLYCVVDGCLMHVYKKPTDRRQSKSYKLTGVKVKTPEDYQREQLSSLGGKKVSSSILKHPRSFEIVWKNGKTYQFVVPKDGDFHLWVNALRSSSAIDQHLSYDPREFESTNKIKSTSMSSLTVINNNNNNNNNTSNSYGTLNSSKKLRSFKP